MDLFPREPVSIHLVDENFLFADDLKEKYSLKNRFKFNFYPSADKFILEISNRPYLFEGINVVILAVGLARPDKQLSSDLITKCLIVLPDAYIISVCHEKEFGKEVSFLSENNIMHIVNNDNTLYRVDNAIKWVLAKTNLEKKQKIYRWALFLFLASIIMSAAILILMYLL